MSGGWNDIRRDALTQDVRRARQRQRDARALERVDGVLISVLIVGLLGCIAAGLFAARAVDRSGLGDPDVLRPLPDHRILQNLRDSDADFVGGTMMGSGRSDLLLLREDGQITEYDPRTGLMQSSALPRQGGAEGLETAAVSLGSGCGLLLNADNAEGLTCPDADVVHVMSEGGGVLRRDGTGWQVLLHDGAWIGLAGTPVEQDDITAWAASESGRLVAILAGAQGVAIYDNRAGRWSIPEDQQSILDALDSGPIRLVPNGETFWLASRRGLGQLSGGWPIAQLNWSAERGTAFLDLIVTPDDDTMAIVEGLCSETGGGTDCLTVVQVQGVDQVIWRAGDLERVPDLEQPSLEHAMIQDGKLVTLGRSGIHSYDPDLRSWTTIFPGRIDAFDAGSDGRIAAVQGGTAVLVADAEISRRRDVEGGPFRQIALAGPLAYGLGEDGILRDLSNDAVLHGDGGGVPEGATLVTGAAIDDFVLLAGPDGALLHDVSRRRMTWIGAEALDAAALVTQRGIRIVAAHRRFWAVAAGRGRVYALSVDGSYPGQTLSAVQLDQRAAPLASVTADAGGLWIVDAEGLPWSIDATGAMISPVGEPRRGGRGDPTMAAAFPAGLVFADASAIWTYRTGPRTWEGPFSLPPGGTLRGVSVGNGFFSLMSDGSVHRSGDGSGYTEVLNGGSAGLGLSDVTDAALVGSDVLLAGRGIVQSYDPVRGRFDKVWQGGAGAVRLVRPSLAAPVWLSSGRLLRGDDLVTDQSIRGAWDAPDGILAEAQRPDGDNFTILFPDNGGPDCHFLGAGPPTGDIIDGIGLGDGRVIVATSSSFGLHDPDTRRWIRFASRPLAADERLHIAGGHLLAVGRGRFRAMPLGDIPDPASCAPPRAQLDWTVDETAQAVSLDTEGGRVAVLYPDGALLVWSDGRFRRELEARTNGPDFSQALGIAAAPGSVLVATPDAVWRYEQSPRRWREIPYTLLGAPAEARITEIDMREVAAAQGAMTVWTADGRSYGGSLGIDGDAVTLTELDGIALPRIPLPPAQITDMSQSLSTWAVASDRVMVFGGRGDTDLDAELTLEPGVQPSPFDWGATRSFVQGDPATPDGMWILPPETALQQITGRLADKSLRYDPGTDRNYGLEQGGATLWRIAEDGTLLSCEVRAGARSDADCVIALVAPDRLAPDAIDLAARHDDRVFVVANGDLLTVDDRYRNLRQLAGPRVDSDSQFFESENRLYLLEERGGTIWRVSDDAAVRVADNVDALVRHAGRTLAEIDGQVFEIDAENGVTTLSLIEPSHALTFDWFGDSGFTGIGADGRAVDETGSPRNALPVPGADSVRAILSEWSGRAFWVLDDLGMLDRLAADDCALGPRRHGEAPCLSSSLSQPIAAADLGRLLGQTSIPGGVTRLIFSEGVLEVDRDGAAVRSAAINRRFAVLAPTEVTADLRRRIEVGPSGRPEIAPPTISNRRLRAPGTTVPLAGSPERWGAVDLGWFRWDRNTSELVFDGVSGPVSVPAPNAIRRQTIIAARSGRASSFESPGAPQYAWLTPEGLWHYDAGRNGPQLVSLQEQPGPVGLSDGQFLLPDGGRIAADDGNRGTALDSRDVNLGDLTVIETLRSNDVAGRLGLADGTNVDALAARGFRLDVRQGVGFLGDRLVLSTPVGLVPWNGSLSAIDPAPERTPPRRIVSRGSDSFAETGQGSWLQRAAPGQWSRVSDPFAARVIARETGLEWSVTASGLRIEPVTAADAWRAERQGLSFAADRFVSVAANRSGVVLGTALGTHDLAQSRDLSSPGPASDAAPPREPFDALFHVTGRSVIFDGSGNPQTWDRSAGGWRRPASSGEMPWQDRRVIDGAILRLDVAAGRARAWRRLSDASGETRWASFSWPRGGMMPFDRALSIHASSESVWIGSSFGLRRFDARGGARADLFDVERATGAASAAPVTRLGRPKSAPGREIATTDGAGCVELGPTTLTGQCGDSALLAEREVIDTALWSWTQRDGQIEGIYPARDGPDLTARLGASGRWPHDTLRAWADCGGRELQLWSDGRTLRDPLTTRALPEAAVGIWCQSDTARLGSGADLAPDRYVVGSEVLAPSTGGVWRPIQPTQSAAVLRRFGGDVLYDAERMRIVSGPVRTSFRHRTVADDWRILAWNGERLAIDRTLGFAVREPGIVRITPSGGLGHGAGRPSTLDPDRMLIETADRFGAFDGCEVAEIERQDGRTHAVPARTGAPLRLRCVDGRYFAESGAVGDIGAYEIPDEDPFEHRQLIDTAHWNWSRTRPDPGAPPIIAAEFQGETTAIAAGRFPMDTFSGLAAIDGDRLEVVAADGWRSHSIQRLGVQQGARPTAVSSPRDVEALTVDRGEDGPELCVSSAAGALTLGSDGRPRQAESCARWRGEDILWTYRDVVGQGPEAFGTAANGPRLVRSVEAGRFSDLVATGLPRSAEGEVAVPTADGVLIVSPGAGPRAIYSFGEAAGLLPDAAGTPVLATASGVLALDPAASSGIVCRPLEELLTSTGDALSVRSLERRGEVLRLQGRDPDGRAVVLTLDCDAETREPMRDDIGVDDRVRHAALLRHRPDATAVLRLQSVEDSLVVSDGHNRSMSFDTSGTGALLTLFGIDQGRSALAVFEREVLSLDVDAALSLLAETAPAPETPTSEPASVIEATPEVESETIPELEIRQAQSAPEPAEVSTRPPSLPELPGSGVEPPTEQDAASAPPAPLTDSDGEVPFSELDQATIATIQQRLLVLGHYRLPVDGRTGPGTRAAVRLYQEDLGAPVTSVLTRGQIALLLESDP